MRWTYCERWNDLRSKPLTPFDEDEARCRHDSGELYTAVGERPDEPDILVEVRLENGYVGTRFLDDLGRNSLVYNFREADGRMFLQEIISYTYAEESGVRGRIPLVVESFTYTPEGICRHEVDDSRAETIKTVDRDSVDVGSHWEPIPSFGEYSSVTRWDRENE